jgi:hypothetical protein
MVRERMERTEVRGAAGCDAGAFPQENGMHPARTTAKAPSFFIGNDP